ncbi:CheR family methyltransferase [uncultured Aureimonas sp.]|uniref:CheR family methyltransferase n=1 Tax=uncultured Aureimonas sp. TaxID=1604662 RepID=UPI0025E21867|nr:CheR family methyltransferase [uncultured Aureimonas sp.]
MTMPAAVSGRLRKGDAAPPLLARVEREIGLGFRSGNSRLIAALERFDAAQPTVAPETRWQSFVEDLLVHETFFFRHPRQLAAIERDVLPDLLARSKASGRASVSVWSASCSTSEEVWTLALIAEAAIPGAASITGTDLSADAIETARAETYRRSAGLGSFRSLPRTAPRGSGRRSSRAASGPRRPACVGRSASLRTTSSRRRRSGRRTSSCAATP